MSRPLVITDCDEVLLHMVTHFRDWLDEDHGIEFQLQGNDFSNALKRREDGSTVDTEEIWRLLNLFFDGQMDRQTLIAGADEAMGALGEMAEVVVLTNLKDHRQDDRARQLARFGIELPVYTNQGPKGPAIRNIVNKHEPSCVVFIDDIANHHRSAAEEVSHSIRLHFCGEPTLAPHIECGHKAGHADARIDSWADALPWLQERLKENT